MHQEKAESLRVCEAFGIGAKRWARICAVLLLVAFIGACANGAKDIPLQTASTTAEGAQFPSDEDKDPLEILNRFVFAFNETLDVFIFKPVAATYRKVVPDGVRDSVRNALRNMGAPVVFANDVMQGELERAEVTASRFFLNTVLGLGGLFDVATDMGYPYHDEDFGQTLGVHGVGDSFYLVLPLLGPSNIRDATGRVVDGFIDPWGYAIGDEGSLARFVVSGVDTRSRNIETLEELQRDSIDFYARIRSLYLQNRESEIRNGVGDESVPAPGLSGNESISAIDPAIAAGQVSLRQ